MDFESRNTIWSTLQANTSLSEDSTNKLCKVCMALEIFKLAVCAGDCNQCEDNLLSILTESIPEKFIQNHLLSIKSNTYLSFKLEEIEKKLPMYIERQQSVVSVLSKKVEMLASAAEKLRLENLNLKDIVLKWQTGWLASQEKTEKLKREIIEIKAFQGELMKTIQNYFNDSKVLWEVVGEYMKGSSMENKVSALDDAVIEEMAKIDQLWEEVRNLKESHEKLEKNVKDLTQVRKHCYNLDQTAEKIQSYSTKACENQKLIETRLQQLTEYLGIKQIEKANEEYRVKVQELRKKTSECLLKPN